MHQKQEEDFSKVYQKMVPQVTVLMVGGKFNNNWGESMRPNEGGMDKDDDDDDSWGEQVIVGTLSPRKQQQHAKVARGEREIA